MTVNLEILEHAGDGRTEPEHFAIVPQFGSAYYLAPPDEPELIQVPLSGSGEPCWEEESGPYFGGGAVDMRRVAEADLPLLEMVESILAATAPGR